MIIFKVEDDTEANSMSINDIEWHVIDNKNVSSNQRDCWGN